MSARTIQTYLVDGNLEGVRIVEFIGGAIRALVIPRLKLNDAKKRPEINQPALYFLIDSGENQVYIGESDNFLHRIKTHDRQKSFWDTVVVVVSATNSFEKGDVKYLESTALIRAKNSAAMRILNKNEPVRNNVHEFKVQMLDDVLNDVALIVESLGFSLFTTKEDDQEAVWYCKSKNTNAKAVFRGGQFIVLAGSIIDKSHAKSWEEERLDSYLEREKVLREYGVDFGGVFELKDNIPFRSPNQAGQFLTGRSVNAWTTFKDATGRTMDEVVRKNGA
jgi:hypothetical protein